MKVTNRISLRSLNEGERKNYRSFRRMIRREFPAIVGTVQLSAHGRSHSVAAFSESGKLLSDWNI